MNSIFKFILGTFTGLYKLSQGRIGGRMAGLNVLLLTTIGRKTGKRRTTPLGYFEHDGSYVIIASNGGSDRHPFWFLNLKNNPNVRVQIKDKEISATAQEAEPGLRKKLWTRLVGLSPQYGQYEKSTKRQIPLILLQPIQ